MRQTHRPTWVTTDSMGVVYQFPSIHAGWIVRVGVPSDTVMRNAVSVALRAAVSGLRLYGQSRVDRVRVN